MSEQLTNNIPKPNPDPFEILPMKSAQWWSHCDLSIAFNLKSFPNPKTLVHFVHINFR